MNLESIDGNMDDKKMRQNAKEMGIILPERLEKAMM